MAQLTITFDQSKNSNIKGPAREELRAKIIELAENFKATAAKPEYCTDLISGNTLTVKSKNDNIIIDGLTQKAVDHFAGAVLPTAGVIAERENNIVIVKALDPAYADGPKR